MSETARLARFQRYKNLRAIEKSAFLTDDQARQLKKLEGQRIKDNKFAYMQAILKEASK